MANVAAKPSKEHGKAACLQSASASAQCPPVARLSLTSDSSCSMHALQPAAARTRTHTRMGSLRHWKYCNSRQAIIDHPHAKLEGNGTVGADYLLEYGDTSSSVKWGRDQRKSSSSL